MENRSQSTRKNVSDFLKACFNGTIAFLGVGILSTPYALSNGGWYSILIFLLIAGISYYSAILIRRCMDADGTIRSFAEIANRAFGKKGMLAVLIMANLELYLVAIGLHLMEGDNLQKLFPGFRIDLGSVAIGGRESFILITTLAILPTMMVTDMGKLSYASATGVVSCLIILAAVIHVGAINGVGFHAKGTMYNGSHIFMAISLYVVCFGGHPVIPLVYTSMQQPHHFNMVLFVSFFLTTLMYMSMAVVGYLMYGSNVGPQITLSLPTNTMAAKIAIYTTLVMPITRYPLIVAPIATSIEGQLSNDLHNKKFVKIGVRLTLLLGTMIVAYIFPHYESLMSIIGSIFVVFTSFFIPCLCYLKISGLYQSVGCDLIFGICIILIGAFVMVSGLYANIAQLVRHE